MQLDNLFIDKDSEFFIAIANQGNHSFLMLGVVNDDGKPTLLARVGKIADIDPDGSDVLKMYRKSIVSHIDTRVADEGLWRNDRTKRVKGQEVSTEFSADISYQAYSINLEQYKEFLSLTAAVENHQKEHYINIKSARAKRNMNSGIECYIPSERVENGLVIFEHTNLKNIAANDVQKTIINGATQLNLIKNTCRTTAKAMLEHTLGFTTKASACFIIGLDYKTTLKGNLQTPEPFYILPPPPPLNSADIAPAQLKVLKELYKKLEDLPHKDPGSEITRNKFNKLKNLYKELAPTKPMPLQDLLDTITSHRAANSTLFDTPRGQSIIGKFATLIGLNKTGTQKAYDTIEKALNQEIKRQKSLPSYHFSFFKEEVKLQKEEKKQITQGASNTSTAENDDGNNKTLPSPGDS